MTRAFFVCQVGCEIDCSHGLPCVVYMIDRDHPHPTARGHEEHYALEYASGELHTWRGKAGRCQVTQPREVES